eukprot:71620-Rhodomonas_salina.1
MHEGLLELDLAAWTVVSGGRRTRVCVGDRLVQCKGAVAQCYVEVPKGGARCWIFGKTGFRARRSTNVVQIRRTMILYPYALMEKPAAERKSPS